MEDIAFDAEEKHCLYCDKVTIHIKRFERDAMFVRERCSVCRKQPHEQYVRRPLSRAGQRRLGREFL